MQLREALAAALGAVSLFTLSSCVLLPVRTAPGVEGTVVDRVTGKPVEGAIVLVRFDGAYDDVLPDRDQLGHAEATTGRDGAFAIERYTRGGLTLWPHFRTERRVVGVIREGYRCPNPLVAPDSGRLMIRLAPALDPEDMRDSCRPVSARPGEATGYMTAWRGLFPTGPTPAQRDRRRQLDRLLEARTALGFGNNCEGPVLDLALAPGGHLAAFVAQAESGPAVHLVGLGPDDPGRPEVVAEAYGVPPRRLAWTGPDELLLWQPSSQADRSISPSIFAPGHNEVVWHGTTALPASIDRGTPASSHHTSTRRPLDPEDLSDEADTLWLGRSFELERQLEPETGLSRDRLLITGEDGRRREIDLPGESCGGARFGRPHYRIAAGGRIGLDLRWVEQGCHAVRIDLETGAWARVDRAAEQAVCRAERSIPPAQLRAGLRGWAREVEGALASVGADPSAAYSLHIEEGGATHARSRNASGEFLHVKVPDFPLATPLQRIDVTTVAPGTPATKITIEATPQGMEPL